MDVRSLKHVVTLARLLSFTKAAQELSISQSALTKSIQSIERRANVRLFDRDRGGVHLTTVGRIFAERAATLLRDADDLDRSLSRAAHGIEGEVAIGMGPMPAAILLPDVLREELASDLHVHVSVRIGDELLPMLKADKIEFIVCAEGEYPGSSRLNAASLGWFPVSLLVRAGHPLARQDSRAEITDFPLVVSGPLDRTPTFAAFLKRKPQYVIDDHSVLRQITENSDAVWLSSAYIALDAISKGHLKEITLPMGRSAARIRMLMYTRERRSLSPGALRLKDRFRSKIHMYSKMYKKS